MVNASELCQGMCLRIEGQIFKVLEVDAKAGAGKMGGVVKAKLINIKTGRSWEPHFRPQEKLEELGLEHRPMEFLYSEGDTYTFMNLDTYEQVGVPKAILGGAFQFLQPGMELPVELFGGDPISVVFPDTVEIRVSSTAPPSHSQQDSAWKQATLENGLTVLVPLFIAPGEMVRIGVNSGRYVERVRMERKHSA
jgi:elongation factor P